MKKLKLLKIVIVVAAILAVFYYTTSCWLEMRTTYGEYGNGNFVADDLSGHFYFPFAGKNFENNQLSSFEKETIYREAIEYKYNLAFMKIFLFAGIVFTSAFLALKVLPDNK
jgi:hypothetical protein